MNKRIRKKKSFLNDPSYEAAKNSWMAGLEMEIGCIQSRESEFAGKDGACVSDEIKAAV